MWGLKEESDAYSQRQMWDIAMKENSAWNERGRNVPGVLTDSGLYRTLLREAMGDVAREARDELQDNINSLHFNVIGCHW